MVESLQVDLAQAVVDSRKLWIEKCLQLYLETHSCIPLSSLVDYWQLPPLRLLVVSVWALSLLASVDLLNVSLSEVLEEVVVGHPRLRGSLHPGRKSWKSSPYGHQKTHR